MSYKILTFDQGSDEWFKIKKNHISGTISYDLLKNGKQYALQQAYKHATNSMKYSGPVSKAVKSNRPFTLKEVCIVELPKGSMFSNGEERYVDLLEFDMS